MARDNSNGGAEGRLIRAILRKVRDLYENDAAKISMVDESLQAAHEAAIMEAQLPQRDEAIQSGMNISHFCST